MVLSGSMVVSDMWFYGWFCLDLWQDLIGESMENGWFCLVLWQDLLGESMDGSAWLYDRI